MQCLATVLSYDHSREYSTVCRKGFSFLKHESSQSSQIKSLLLGVKRGASKFEISHHDGYSLFEDQKAAEATVSWEQIDAVHVSGQRWQLILQWQGTTYYSNWMLVQDFVTRLNAHVERINHPLAPSALMKPLVWSWRPLDQHGSSYVCCHRQAARQCLRMRWTLRYHDVSEVGQVRSSRSIGSNTRAWRHLLLNSLRPQVPSWLQRPT
jgi:hypothetical protein